MKQFHWGQRFLAAISRHPRSWAPYSLSRL
jgi:hypothetical protein